MATKVSSSESGGKAQLEALLDLINMSVRDAIAEYEKSGHGVPSLDSQHLHPFKLDSSYDTLALKKAVRVLEGACESLCTTLAQPGHTLTNVRGPFLRLLCLWDHTHII